MHLFRRALALVLAAVLLPSACLAGSFSTGFRLTFDLADSEEPLIHGLSDLFRYTTLTGTAAMDGNAFDIHGTVRVSDRFTSEITVDFKGLDSLFMVNSSLFGDTTLMINSPALIEYGIKMHSHLGLSLYWLTLLFPYAWQNAFATPAALWQKTMHAEAGSRTVSAEAVSEFLLSMSDLTYNDRGFDYWTQAMGLSTGIESLYYEMVDALTWACDELPEEGIIITAADDGSEVWTVNGEVILTSGADGFSFSLTELLSGREFTGAMRHADGLFSFELNIGGAEEEEQPALLLSARADHLPEYPGAEGAFSLDLSVSGSAAYGIPAPVIDGSGSLSLPMNRPSADIHVEGDASAVRFVDPVSGKTWLTVATEWTEWKPDHMPAYTREDIKGVNFFSLTESTLAELIENIKYPFVFGVLSFAGAAPTSICTALMDFVSDLGLLNLNLE